MLAKWFPTVVFRERTLQTPQGHTAGKPPEKVNMQTDTEIT